MPLNEMNDSSGQYFHLAIKKKHRSWKTKEHDIHNINKVSQKVYVVEC